MKSYSALTAGNQHQQVTSASKFRLELHCYFKITSYKTQEQKQ